MKYARVALDIETRALFEPFTYAVPQELQEEALVGTCVCVPLGSRLVAGYVLELFDELDAFCNPNKIKPIKKVLTAPVFLPQAAELAPWIAQEYASPLISAVRLFLPPGFSAQVKESAKRDWAPILLKSHDNKELWLLPSKTATQYKPAKHAVRQREVLTALSQGPLRLKDITALIPGAKAVVNALVKKGIIVEQSSLFSTSHTHITTLSSAVAKKPRKLTDDQKQAFACIEDALARKDGQVVLLDGVTGSGKTEVYLLTIEEILKKGERAIVLVPEISLTAQTLGRFQSRFGDTVAMLHSRLSIKERSQEWWRIMRGDARVVVGARSALFAPIKNCSLIVIDEEHETSYKQDKAPRYHARDVAKQMARTLPATLILGSATPSIESLSHVRDVKNQEEWRWARMTHRPQAAQLPAIQIVDMRQESQKNRDGLFSDTLANALQETFAARKKSVCLLNQRGFSSFLECQDCGCVPTCPHCSSSLTYHAKLGSLMCHSCGQSWPYRAYPAASVRCPACGSPYLKAVGVGTERVEAELKRLLPEAPIVRMDADTTRTKNAHTTLLEAFDAQEAAVLLGTQMIAKGLDFPDVTLVGVVNADISLKLPDFRAPEKTHALLEQVAGRAGRGQDRGRVIIQTSWPTHPAIATLTTHNRDPFIASALSEREEALYPPFVRLGNIVVSSKDQAQARAAVETIATRLRQLVAGISEAQVIGPSACLLAKHKDRWRYHVMLKLPLAAHMGSVLSEAAIDVGSKNVSVALDVDAYDMF